MALRVTTTRHAIDACRAPASPRISPTVLAILLDVARRPAFPESEIEQPRGGDDHGHAAGRRQSRGARRGCRCRAALRRAIIRTRRKAKGHARGGRADGPRGLDLRSTSSGSGPPPCRSRSSETWIPPLRWSSPRRSWKTGPRRRPSTCRCRRLRSATCRRVARVAMPGKAQADIAYGFNTISRLDPALLRVLDDEQHARPVRPRRAAGGQHPRAPGHGLLRLQHLRSRASAKARCSSAPASIRANVERTIDGDRRRGADAWPPDGPTAGRGLGDARVPGRIDSAACSRPTRASPPSCRPPSDSASALDYDRRLPGLLRAVTMDEVRRGRRRRRSTRSRPPSDSRGPELPVAAAASTELTRAAGHDPSGLLRRRLHADPSRAPVPGRRLPRVLRAARHRRGPDRVRRGRGRRFVFRSTRAAASTIPTSSSATRGGSSRGWAAAATALDDAARDIYDEWSACHHFTLYEEVPGRAARDPRRRREDRAHLEHATVPRHRSRPTSSSRPVLGRACRRRTTAT